MSDVSIVPKHPLHHGTAATSLVVKDPVCGMEVDPATSEHHVTREGETY